MIEMGGGVHGHHAVRARNGVHAEAGDERDRDPVLVQMRVLVQEPCFAQLALNSGKCNVKKPRVRAQENEPFALMAVLLRLSVGISF